MPNAHLDLVTRLRQWKCWHRPVRSRYYDFNCPKCDFNHDDPTWGISFRSLFWLVTGRYPRKVSPEGAVMLSRFCEFTGDEKHVWDEPGHKKLCQHAGFERCQLHGKPLGELFGRRVCCEECTAPIQVKEL